MTKLKQTVVIFVFVAVVLVTFAFNIEPIAASTGTSTSSTLQKNGNSNNNIRGRKKKRFLRHTGKTIDDTTKKTSTSTILSGAGRTTVHRLDSIGLIIDVVGQGQGFPSKSSKDSKKMRDVRNSNNDNDNDNDRAGEETTESSPIPINAPPEPNRTENQVSTTTNTTTTTTAAPSIATTTTTTICIYGLTLPKTGDNCLPSPDGAYSIVCCYDDPTSASSGTITCECNGESGTFQCNGGSESNCTVV